MCKSACFFLFTQKTAYEMRISDWISDVCSSDLTVRSSLAAYTLHDNVENLVVVGGGDGAGNALDNQLSGDAGDNILDGGDGIDTVMLDGAITDYEFTLVGGNVTVTSAAGGTDTLLNIERAAIGGLSYNLRSEEHTSEHQSLMSNKYGVFCCKK